MCGGFIGMGGGHTYAAACVGGLQRQLLQTALTLAALQVLTLPVAAQLLLSTQARVLARTDVEESKVVVLEVTCLRRSESRGADPSRCP